MTIVTLHQLSKLYAASKTHAVRDLSLVIPSGKIVALLGPSGCGKTTALKMIAGLIEPTAGDIRFDDQSVLSIPAERRGAVMVFQNHLLFPYMSVGDNVGFGLKMRGERKRDIRPKVADMLALVKLPGFADRRPKQLSGGQQQRVALARALIVEPKVLLLDEPLSNLDAHLRGEMRELILNIQRQLNITTIFVTHDQEEAIMMADQVALIFEGQLQQFDEPRAFYEQPVSQPVAQFFGGVNFVAGVKQGHQIDTALGSFQAPPQPLPNGPVKLTIRPENLKLMPASPVKSSAVNTIEATICDCLYLGTHIRFRLEKNGQFFEVVTEASRVDQFRLGASAHLHFPVDKIWLLPSETKNVLDAHTGSKTYPSA